MIMVNDNGVTEGLDVYNAKMRGPKCSAWEGGTRAFSFWRWPGKWKPRLLNNLTAHLDVFPTICELTGTKIPANLKTQSGRTQPAPSAGEQRTGRGTGKRTGFSSTMSPAGPADLPSTTSMRWQAYARVTS